MYGNNGTILVGDEELVRRLPGRSEVRLEDSSSMGFLLRTSDEELRVGVDRRSTERSRSVELLGLMDRESADSSS